MAAPTQQERLRDYIAEHPIVWFYELRKFGIFAMTIARAVESGELVRLSRGLYQRPNADLDTLQALAEAAKLVPQGVVALTSALAFHGLTDQIPREVWMAVSQKDWAVAPPYPPIRITEFQDAYIKQGVEHHQISGIAVPVFSVPKSLADVFRSRLVDRSVAIEALRSALQHKKTSPAAIAKTAIANGAWKKMKPYLEALTSNAKEIRNRAASIKQQLSNHARREGRVFEIVMIRYALERLLFRLSMSDKADRFILKGGMLVTLWLEGDNRETRDVDFLAYGQADGETLKLIFGDIMAVELDDGLVLDVEGLQAEVIREEMEYNGVRLRTVALLERTRIPVTIDSLQR